MSLKNQFLNNYTHEGCSVLFLSPPLPLDYEILLAFINNHPFQILSTRFLWIQQRVTELSKSERQLLTIIIYTKWKDLYKKKELMEEK